jgi:hypothetical protein
MLRGTFHFHSTYSHDGMSTIPEIAATLRDNGFSFCVMTEHFEDFDGPKFARFVDEVGAVSRSSGFLLVPGMEVDLAGLHTIMFPVRSHDEIVRITRGESEAKPRLFKVVAHPSKYRFDDVKRHLDTYDIDGIELWNQQADGAHIPPMAFLDLVKSEPWRNRYRMFFGNDIHNVNLKVANVLCLPSRTDLTVESVSRCLGEGDFVALNAPTGVSYRNGSQRTEFDAWFAGMHKQSYLRGRMLRTVRRSLRSVYRMLPRDMQHSLNNFKNYVRNKV